jgi:hypothetical protein
MQKASTITMTCDLSTTVNIELVFNLISILHPRNPDESRFIHPKNVRSKIPFFGIENAIVSAKYKGVSKGIRSGQNHMMNNVVSLDLNCMDKNINLKLARSKIQLTGATSYEMGEHAFNVLCAHINMIQTNLSHINELSSNGAKFLTLKKRTEEWVLETVKSKIGSGTALRLPYIDMDAITAEKAHSGIDETYASFLWQYTDDFDDFDSFAKKVEWISNRDTSINVVESEVSASNINISNSVYNFRIGEEISLIQLTKHLIKKGLSVEFHNWNASHLKISIPVMEDGKNVLSNTNKIKAHRFSVHRNDSVKQTSPTFYEDAISARQMFIDAIADYTPSY